ncbi:unnamed protein product [Haemonchus placei]|uniref:7TM chemoreceptor n=1 Tax=Haemonchus placei TaxID=6290 RepID=A0A0N4X1C9_HAEPC|nr:unnamed protein product [Haemonchus placei]
MCFQHGLTMFSYILLVEALVMMFLVGCVGLLCAVMIQLFISRMSMSNLTRTSHRQILTLLLIQVMKKKSQEVFIQYQRLTLFANVSSLRICTGATGVTLIFVQDKLNFYKLYYYFQNMFQTACPIFLLHIPLYTMYGLLFTGATSPHWLGITIGIMMALFPLISPITIFAFIKDYRRFILSKLFWINCKGMSKRSSKNVVRVKAGLTGSNKTEP